VALRVIHGIHHLGLTVTLVDASAGWYERVLGFRRVGVHESPDGARRKVFLRHDGFAVRLGLTQHRTGPIGDFDETRVGLDHLAFAVDDRDELASWWTRLATAGVACSPVAPANSIPGAFVLVLP
jgi:glyoxylase I family protein